MPRRVIHLVFLIALCLAPIAGAAEPWLRPARNSIDPLLDPLSAGRPPVRSIGPVESLPNSAVQALAVDPRGYLWIGTEDGAVTYNGRTWTTVNTPTRHISNFINVIAPVRDSIYFGTDGTLCELRDGQWVGLFDRSTGLPGTRVSSVVEWAADPNAAPSLWVGVDQGIARRDGATWTTVDQRDGLPGGAVTCLTPVVLPGGARVLYAGTEKGLARFDGKHWQTVDFGFVPASTTVSEILPVDLPDGTQELWVGTADGILRESGGVWSAITTADGLPHNFVYCLAVTTAADGARIVWAGTHSGLASARLEPFRGFTRVLDVSTESLLAYSSTGGSAHTQILFVGTTDRGLLAVSLGLCTVFDKDSGLADAYVWTIYETITDDGEPMVWMGGFSGLARLWRGKWTRFETTWENPGNTVRSLLETRDADGKRTFWVGTWKGLGVLEGAHIAPYAIPADVGPDVARCLKSTIYAMVESVDAQGNVALWFGGREGLVRHENGTWTYFGIDEGLPDKVVRSLYATRDRDGNSVLWVGTDYAGLARYSNGVWTGYNLGSGLPNNSIHGLASFVLESGRRVLCVGTFGGGVAFRDLDDDTAPWTVLSDEASSNPILPNNVIYQIKIDARQQIYLFTSKGAVRLRVLSDDLPLEFDTRVFTTEEGLLSNEYNSGGAMVDHLGRVWAGSVSGIAVFNPNFETVSGPSPLHVERTFLGDQLRPIEGADLSHNENNLSFEYALLSFYRESDTRYRSQLVGFENEPTDWVTNYRRDFTNLSAGSYTFRVWARDYAGNISGPTEIAFAIRPALWNTSLAYALYALAFVGLTLGVIRLRTSALKRRTALLERKVAERTAKIERQAEQLRASEARAHAANRAKSVFLANMSHELRTPLNAVIGFAQLLERDPSLGPVQQDNVSSIVNSGEHLLGLINDVLSISKIEAERTTINESTFDLGRLLESLDEIVRIRASAKGVGVRFDVAADLPKYVRGDEGKLRQILINLLSNAVKFTDRGAVTLRLRRDGDDLYRIEVADTGAGIAPEELQSLFEPFVQTESGRQSNEGTGLGLAISRSFARLMGGDITVESERGRGSTFTLALNLPPATETADDRRVRRVVGVRATGAAARVLVVDDNALNRTVLTRLFASLGCETREASNGAEAVAQWEAWAPGLILMDVRMPGIDGVAATQRIREAESANGERHARTAIIACSASVFDQDREAILAAGCDDFIPKPFRESVLFEAIARCLDVEFVMAEGEPDVVEDSTPVEGLADLPSEVLAHLDRALKVGDMQLTLEAINQIEEYSPDLASRLRVLASRYAIDELIDMVEASIPKP